MVRIKTDTEFKKNKKDIKRKISKSDEEIDVIFTAKETYYYKMIKKFFKKTDKDNIDMMLDVINGKSKISLRLLDWFVTRYAKKYKTSYNINDGYDRFNVHISYKAQLKSYKKRYFDPFRRRKKFYYVYNKNDSDSKLYTTIGQLNFFRWAIINGVIDYVKNSYDTIIEAMIQSNKKDKLRKQNNTNKKQSKATIKKNKVTVRVVKKVKDNTIVLSFN